MFQLVNSVTNWMDLSFISTIKLNLSERLERRRLYKQTINELSSLTDRELHDIGLSRSMIRSVAEEMYNPNLKGWV